MHRTVLVVRNISHEGPGILKEVLDEEQIAVDYCDLSRGETIPDPQGYGAIVVLGGPQSANDDTPAMRHQLQRVREVLDAGIPFLGICLGLQVLVKAAGGWVVKCQEPETGFRSSGGTPYTIELTAVGRMDMLFDGIADNINVFQLHGETVVLPDNATLLAMGNRCPNQVVRVGSNAYGLQCHCEMTRDMFDAWCRIDPSLMAMDRTALLLEFDAVEQGYTITGRSLMRNFLSLAGFFHAER